MTRARRRWPLRFSIRAKLRPIVPNSPQASKAQPAALVASRPLATPYKAPAARPPASAMRTAERPHRERPLRLRQSAPWNAPREFPRTQAYLAKPQLLNSCSVQRLVGNRKLGRRRSRELPPRPAPQARQNCRHARHRRLVRNRHPRLRPARHRRLASNPKRHLRPGRRHKPAKNPKRHLAPRRKRVRNLGPRPPRPAPRRKRVRNLGPRRPAPPRAASASGTPARGSSAQPAPQARQQPRPAASPRPAPKPKEEQRKEP